MKKISCTPINPKKYSCNGLKNSYKEFDNGKKFLRLDSPPTPITFLMVRPGILIFVVNDKSYEDMIDDRL